MRAIIINPKDRTVSVKELDVSRGSLRALQNEVGGLVEVAAALANGDDLLVNEEGLLYGPEHFFSFVPNGRPDEVAFFAGTGIVVGTRFDGEGVDWVDAASMLESIKARVSWFSLLEIKALLSPREHVV